MERSVRKGKRDGIWGEGKEEGESTTPFVVNVEKLSNHSHSSLPQPLSTLKLSLTLAGSHQTFLQDKTLDVL